MGQQASSNLLLLGAIAAFCLILPLLFELIATTQMTGRGRGGESILTMWTLQGITGAAAFGLLAVGMFGLGGVSIGTGVFAILRAIALLMLFVMAVGKVGGLFEAMAYAGPISAFLVWIFIGITGFSSKDTLGGLGVVVGILSILAAICVLTPNVLMWARAIGRGSADMMLVLLYAGIGLRVVAAVLLGVGLITGKNR